MTIWPVSTAPEPTFRLAVRRYARSRGGLLPDQPGFWLAARHRTR